MICYYWLGLIIIMKIVFGLYNRSKKYIFLLFRFALRARDLRMSSMWVILMCLEHNFSRL
jgi:hypothetical protein